MKLARQRSVALAKEIDAGVAQCYENAMRAVLTVPALSDAWYVEGVAVSSWPVAGMGIVHAWVETRDGMILDPTLALRDPVFKRARWPLNYQAVARYTREEANRRAEETGKWWRWEDDQEHAQAMTQAMSALWWDMARSIATPEQLAKMERDLLPHCISSKTGDDQNGSCCDR
jgi:hypothetical protein